MQSSRIARWRLDETTPHSRRIELELTVWAAGWDERLVWEHLLVLCEHTRDVLSKLLRWRICGLTRSVRRQIYLLVAPVHDCATAKIEICVVRRVTVVMLVTVKVAELFCTKRVAHAGTERLPRNQIALLVLKGIVVAYLSASVHVIQQMCEATPVFCLSACEGRGKLITPFRCEECGGTSKCSPVVHRCEWMHAYHVLPSTTAVFLEQCSYACVAA